MSAAVPREIYVDLAPVVAAVIASRRDPTARANGPALITGTKVAWRLYFGYVIAQAFDPLNLPDDYSVTLSARRTDNPNATALIDETAATEVQGEDGHRGYEVAVDTTPTAWSSTLDVPDAQRADGVRITFQVTIAAGDASEIYRVQWESILLPSV